MHRAKHKTQKKGDLNLIVSGMLYTTTLIWKTHMKKVWKWSKTSVKKYQKTPTLGRWSGALNLLQKWILQLLHDADDCTLFANPETRDSNSFWPTSTRN